MRGECQPTIVDHVVLDVVGAQGEKLPLVGVLYITNYRFRFDCDLPEELVSESTNEASKSSAIYSFLWCKFCVSVLR